MTKEDVERLRPLAAALTALHEAGFGSAADVANELGCEPSDVRASTAPSVYVGSLDWQSDGVPRCEYLWRAEDVASAPKRWRPTLVV